MLIYCIYNIEYVFDVRSAVVNLLEDDHFKVVHQQNTARYIL